MHRERGTTQVVTVSMLFYILSSYAMIARFSPYTCISMYGTFLTLEGKVLVT